MTILVGFAPGSQTVNALELTTQLAHATGRSAVVFGVTPAPWRFPSMAKVDAEYSQWWTRHAQQTGD